MNTSFSNIFGYGPAGCKKIILQLWWQRFETLYPTEEDCKNEIFSQLHATGKANCKNCQSNDIMVVDKDRGGKCIRCKKKVSLTAGTFFENVRRFRPLWAAIWLIGQGVSFNPCDLEKCVDTVYSSAWKIHKKVSIVIDSALNEQPFAISVNSAYFVDAICKRSRETPANQHPLAEQAETEKRFATEGPNASNTGGKSSTGPSSATTTAGKPPLSASAQAVYDLLSLTPIKIDELSNLSNISVAELSSILVMLELDGLIESLPGAKYVRSNAAASKPAAPLPGTGQNAGYDEGAVVASIVNFIRAGFHGISRKYLQFYVATYWCHRDRGSWSPDSLLRACSLFRTLKYEDILAFVTPLNVKLMPC